MSTRLALIAAAGLAAVASVVGARRPAARGLARRGSRAATCDPSRWAKNNVALDDQGHPLVFYHGSDEPDIEEFDPGKSRTSYGMFFAPDPDTAAFYGKYLYRVWLRVGKLADLDDAMTLRRVAEEAAWGEPVRMVVGDEGWMEADRSDLRKSLHALLAGAWAKDAGVRSILRRWAASVSAQGQVAGGQGASWSEVLDALELERPEEDEAPFAELFSARPALLQAYDKAHPMMNADVASIERSYGGDGFYMNHQDDVLQAAERLGYDGVRMSDPSSTGESVSWVIFDPKRVCVLGREEMPQRLRPR